MNAKLGMIGMTAASCAVLAVHAAGQEPPDLAQLKPLNPAEQLAYERVKDNSTEVRKFVVTRIYARAMDAAVAAAQPDRNCDALEMRRLVAMPTLPGDFVFAYAADEAERLCFYDIAVAQRAPWLASITFARQTPRAEPVTAAVEIEYWRSIQASTDPADFEAYLLRYPTGSFAELARNRLAKYRVPADPCDSLAGVWDWGPMNGDVTFEARGTVSSPRGYSGNWTCHNNQVTIVWSNGLSDHLTLAADRRHLRGHGGFLGLAPITAEKR